MQSVCVCLRESVRMCVFACGHVRLLYGALEVNVCGCVCVCVHVFTNVCVCVCVCMS
jgi:hypothetical protein